MGSWSFTARPAPWNDAYTGGKVAISRPVVLLNDATILVMASRDPLLPSREPRRKFRFNLSFIRDWATGQPLRETESLDYEPIFNKVYFARRMQVDRKFYG